MDHRQFHNWYKRLIESNWHMPPADLWEGITLELDRAFYQWYRQKTEAPDAEPPQSVWDNIQQQLNQDQHQQEANQQTHQQTQGQTFPAASGPPEENAGASDDGLEQAYKAAIEHPDEEPPPQVWNNIQDNLGRDFHQWYASRIENPQEEPSEQVWNNIQDELDIDQSWQRISERLDRSWRKRTRELFTAIAAAALLLFALQIFLPSADDTAFQPREKTNVAQKQETGTQKHDKQQKPSKEEGQKAFQKEQVQKQTASTDQETDPSRERNLQHKVTTEASDKKQTLAMDSRSTQAASAGGQKTKNTPTQKTNASDKNQAKLTHTTKLTNVPRESQLLAKADPVHVQLSGGKPVTPLTAKAPNQQNARAEADQQSENPQPTRFYVGMSGELGNSWLLSDKTLHSIRKSPYSQASPEKGKSFGLLGGINLSDKLDVQMEALITSETGQNYREYIEGQVMNNQIQLNYTALHVAARYEILSSSFQLPVSHHLILGTHAGYLKSARQNTGGETESIRGAYKNYNLGLLVGYELDTRITSRYSFSAGVRFNPGLINIYEGTPSLPARFNETYSSSVNISLAIRYNLSSR